MVIVSGKVIDGRVEVDSELPEGASVTVLAREGDPETECILRDAIARCERGETRTAPWRASLSRVSEPLTVEVSALAASKVHAAETW